MVDGVSCILDFPNISGGGPPPHTHTPYKGNTSIKPSKSFFNNNSSQRQNKKQKQNENPPPVKQSTRNFKYLVVCHLELRAAVLKLVSFPVYLGCYALHYGIIYVTYNIHCIFRLCASVCLCISVMQKIRSLLNRTFSTESYRNWRNSINILKTNELFLKNKHKF